MGPEPRQRGPPADGWSCGASDSTPCRARIGLQADAVRPARTMVREFPASPPSLRATPPPRGGERVTLPSPSRRAGRDKVADGWSAALQTPPPRPHSRAPLLDEEGSGLKLCPPRRE